MGWSTHRPPRNPKYRTPEHLAKVREYKDQLRRAGYLTCTAPVCVFPDRTITNPDGRDRDGVHAGHNPDGVTYAGPQHAACNLKEASTRARAKQVEAKQEASNPKPRAFTTTRRWGDAPTTP